MAKIYYHAVPADWRKEQKYRFLDEHESVSKIDWTEITPDAKQNWLTEGMEKEFDGFISIGNKEAKASNRLDAEAIFKTYGGGIKTSRDKWCFNFNQDYLIKNIVTTLDFFNEHVHRWTNSDKQRSVDDFVSYVDAKIAWSSTLKEVLQRNKPVEYQEGHVRRSLYRPFTKEFLYFDKHLNERTYQFPRIFPNYDSEQENVVICLSGLGHDFFQCQTSAHIVEYKFSSSTNGGTQSFPFYTYNEDGTNRRENITDWALTQFREHYSTLQKPAVQKPTVQKPARSKGMIPGVANEKESPYSVRASATVASFTKWDIFYYTYAILHHPEYREKYAANLKRELPRIPFAPDFWSFAKAGKELANIHVGYEDQPDHKLDMIENGKLALDWRVERMRYNKDKSAIVYNDFLTIGGIPPEVHEYRLGNRSALDWIVDQYKVSIDKRSGITNDPNRDDYREYIVRLIKKIVTVSLRTNEIIKSLPALAEA